MEDLNALNEDLEFDFIELIKEAHYSPQIKANFAQRMIGDDWVKVGGEIIKSFDPKLLKDFEKVVNAAHKNTA